jgi:hypothetical protein
MFKRSDMKNNNKKIVMYNMLTNYYLTHFTTLVLTKTRGASIPNSAYRNDKDESSHYKLYIVGTFLHTNTHTY